MTLPTLLARLTKDGWKLNDRASMISPNGELCLDVSPEGSWQLSALTDSDIAGVAVGRYETVDEGDTLREVPEAIRCAELGIARLVEDDSLYEYAEQKGAGMREDGE